MVVGGKAQKQIQDDKSFYLMATKTVQVPLASGESSGGKFGE